MSRAISPPPLKRRRLEASSPPGGREKTSTRMTGGLQLRVYSWNVNGIAPFLQPSITAFFGREDTASSQAGRKAQPSLRDILKRYEWPTLLMLQEVKIKPDDRASQRAVERAVARRADEEPTNPSYRAFFCLPRDRFNARGFGRKVYGVCTIIREDFFTEYSVMVREVDWDREGRFLVCDTEPRPGVPKLAIFNCYMVNGTNNPYKDSDTGLVQGTRHDRKLRVHELLRAECRSLETQNAAVILAGDMNIARSRLDGHPNLRTNPVQHCKNRADFESKFFVNNASGEDNSLQMIDTFRELHPQEAGYTYYPRHTAFGSSCDRVDMIMLSNSLKPVLKAASIIATPADRGPSDHVPLYAELVFGAHFLDDSPAPAK